MSKPKKPPQASRSEADEQLDLRPCDGKGGSVRPTEGVSCQTAGQHNTTPPPQEDEDVLSWQQIIYLSDRDYDLFLAALDSDGDRMRRCGRRRSALRALTVNNERNLRQHGR
jgi:hypothetical protein